MRFDGFEHLLSHFAQLSPDAPALRYETGTVTFSGLYDIVRKRAAELREAGKTCMGILSDGSPDCVTEIFAANLAGMQLVMLDASLDTPVLMQLIRYTDIDMLWGDEDLVEELEPALTKAREADFVAAQGRFPVQHARPVGQPPVQHRHLRDLGFRDDGARLRNGAKLRRDVQLETVGL